MALIAEEAVEHKCRELTDVWAINGKFWIGDGVRYYPISPTKLQQPKKTPSEDNTTKLLVVLNQRLFELVIVLWLVVSGRNLTAFC
jgi:hypothetical protein